MWQYRSLGEKCIHLSARENIKRREGEMRGEERKCRRGGGTGWQKEEVMKCVGLQGWHWKKPLCPFSLHPSLSLFRNTSHTSSTFLHQLPPTSPQLHPHLWGSPWLPGGTARVPVNAPECHKHFPKADVNEIVVLCCDAARHNAKGRGKAGEGRRRRWNENERRADSRWGEGGKERTGEEMKGEEEMKNRRGGERGVKGEEPNGWWEG